MRSGSLPLFGQMPTAAHLSLHVFYGDRSKVHCDGHFIGATHLPVQTRKLRPQLCAQVPIALSTELSNACSKATITTLSQILPMELPFPVIKESNRFTCYLETVAVAGQEALEMRLQLLPGQVHIFLCLKPFGTACSTYVNRPEIKCVKYVLPFPEKWLSGSKRWGLPAIHTLVLTPCVQALLRCQWMFVKVGGTP